MELNEFKILKQVNCNPYLQQNKLLEYCKKNGIELEAYSPLAMGGAVLKDKVLMEIGEKHNKTVAQVAIKFQAQRGVVVIPKSTHKERIMENFNIFDFELTEDDLAKIAKLDKQH